MLIHYNWGMSAQDMMIYYHCLQEDDELSQLPVLRFIMLTSWLIMQSVQWTPSIQKRKNAFKCKALPPGETLMH